MGLGSRIVTLTPQAADPYSTSHVSRQIVFVSNRPRVKSSSRQVARVKFVRVKSSASTCHVLVVSGQPIACLDSLFLLLKHNENI